MVWGTAVWAVRDGPAGSRVSNPSFSDTSSCRLTESRPCATIVVFYTNATRLFPNGRKTSIAMTSPLVGRGHPGSLLGNRTTSKALQWHGLATHTKLEQQNVQALAYDALKLARFLCKSLYLVTIIITNRISLNVAMTFSSSSSSSSSSISLMSP